MDSGAFVHGTPSYLSQSSGSNTSEAVATQAKGLTGVGEGAHVLHVK